MNHFHQKPSGFLTFLFAFIPGIAQLYMGLVVKGLTLLGSAAACIALMFILNYGSLAFIFVVPTIMIFAYSFFDAFSLRRRLISGQPVEDSCALSVYLRRLLSERNEEGSYKLRLIAGIAILLIGAVSFLSVFGHTWAGFPAYLISSVILPLLFIAAGILLIRKGVRR